MGKQNLLMLKSTFILFLLLSGNELTAQYTYRGRVIKGITGKYMSFGNVLVPIGSPRESRRGTKVAEVDSLGYFSVTLKDSANVRIGIDCSLEGDDYKTVSYKDTLIIFTIDVPCNNYNVASAKHDIKENKLRLLYNGTVYDFPKSKSDEAFEKKYGIQYVNFLDSPEWNDCIKLYNGEIGRFLDEKFGKSWLNEMKYGIQFY